MAHPLANERFIHDDLVKDVERTIGNLRKFWDRTGKVTPVLVTWPAEEIKDDQGRPISDLCTLDLPTEPTLRAKAIQMMVVRTKAYALLLVDATSDAVELLLESPHGTRHWKIPIARHGDLRVLGEAQVRDNVDHVGLLWRPDRVLH